MVGKMTVRDVDLSLQLLDEIGTVGEYVLLDWSRAINFLVFAMSASTILMPSAGTG